MKFKSLIYGLLLLLFGLCIMQMSCSASEGKSYYVSPAGSDNHAGTLEGPFRTIQKGCNALGPGDTLYIKAGEYNEKITINASGTQDAYITIQPFMEDKVILNGEGIQDINDMIYINNKSYIRIKGLELCNSRDGDTPTGIMVEGYGNGIEILNNKIYAVESSDDAHGIAVYGTNGLKPIQDIVIDGNEVYNCKLGSSEAVVVNGNVEGFRISSNAIHDNDNIGIDCIGFEGTAPENDQARSGLITGNKVYNISSMDNPEYEGDACAGGIYVDGGKDVVIEKNTVYSCDIGIEVASEHYNRAATNITVRSNLIYSCGLYGFSIGGASSDNGYAEDCLFLCNTLYDNQVGINIQKSRHNKISSNIIYGIMTLLEGQMGSNTLSCNIWYSPHGNLQRLSGFEDPRFIDSKQQAFGLSKDSPAIGAGDPWYSAGEGETDILGKPRVGNGRVDCGAFEYGEELANTPDLSIVQ